MRKSKVFSDKELLELKELYPVTHNAELAERFGTHEKQIRNIASAFGVKKDYDALGRLNIKRVDIKKLSTNPYLKMLGKTDE